MFTRSTKMARTPPNPNNESVYPCAVCTVTDNRPIVCCDGCDTWFHFECVNAPRDVAEYDWFCVKCRQPDRSIGPQNLNVTSPQEPANTSTNPFSNEEVVTTSIVEREPQPIVSQSIASQRIISQPSVIDLQESTKTAQVNQSGSHKAKSTSTSSTRKRSLALQRLEEQRKMDLEEQVRREQMNREYLDKKYSILEEEVSDEERVSLSFDDEEIHRVSRIDSVKRWAEDAQLQTQTGAIITETIVDVQSSNGHPPIVTTMKEDPSKIDSSWMGKHNDGVPTNRAQHESSPVNRLVIGANDVCVPINSMVNQHPSVRLSQSNERNKNEIFTKILSERKDQPATSSDSNQTQLEYQSKNLPAGDHARIAEINRIRRQNGFPEMSVERYYAYRSQKQQQNGAGSSTETQTFMDPQQSLSATNRPLVQHPIGNHMLLTKRKPEVNLNLNAMHQPSTFKLDEVVGHNQTFVTRIQPATTNMQVSEKNPHVILNQTPVMSTSVYQSNLRDYQQHHHAIKHVAPIHQPTISAHQTLVTLAHQTTTPNYDPSSASNQHQPASSYNYDYTSESTGMPNQNYPTSQPVIVTRQPVNSRMCDYGQTYPTGQPVIVSRQPVNRMSDYGYQANDGNLDGVEVAYNDRQDEPITMQNIMSRQVIDRKLQNFYGNPVEWNAWYNRYLSTTKKCNLDHSENLDRLAKCLKGRAYDIVKSKLSQTEAVPWIINTLQKVFGRPEIVLKAVMKQIREIPPLKNDNLVSLMEFAFEVQSVSTAIEASGLTDQYTNPTLLEDLVEKLPTLVKLDWARHKHQKQNITIKTFTEWLDELADIISTVTEPIVDNNQAKSEKKNEKGKAFVNVHVDGGSTSKETNNSRESNNPKKSSNCPTCGKGCQKLEDCSKFNELPLNSKWKEVNQHKLCRLCLKLHRFPCKKSTVCGKNGCTIKHHHLLHNDDKLPTTVSNHVHHESSGQVMLKYLPVVLYKNNKQIVTFAFFDDGSQASMLEQNLADSLGVTGTKEELCLLWTDNIHRKEQAQRVSIEIAGINDSERRYQLNGIRAVKSLHLPPQTFRREDFIKRFPYLANIPMNSYENAVPGILIASDFPKLGIHLKVVEGKSFHGPIAQKTRLGWTVYGPTGGQTESHYVNNHQVVQMCLHHNQCDQEIHQQIKEYFSIENFGVRANSMTESESKDNQRAMEMLNKLTKLVDGKYETGLLWKNDDINKNLPDSYPMAMKRLVSLEKQGENVVKIIGDKINEYVDKGYARKLSDEEVKQLGTNVWFLPVFGVVHPKKPKKLRMVFDGAAKVKSISLNSMLLTGPDELASLVDILRRFREHLIAVAGDVKEMYHQVKMLMKDQRFQMFLFRNGDTTKKPDIYAMCVMIFGSKCSPAAAQFVKNKNAKRFEKTHPRAVTAIVDNHYVDDMMDGENSVDSAIKMTKDVAMIHASGGFEIRNFISNSPEVLKAMGSEDTCEGKELSLHSELKTERVLGMWWNTQLDVFTFSLKYTIIAKEILNGTKIPTKRELLRTLMSIFDPLGLLSNYLIQLKILLQEMWRMDINWDEQITSSDLVNKWQQWLRYLPSVETVQIPRLYSLKLISKKSKNVEIHTFVDAGNDAFSAVSYMRIENEDGVECMLLGSKAKVAPLKYMSIPRKELQAGVLGARLTSSIVEAQRFSIDRRVFWSDSATVMSWLKSDHRKYSQFVAHRVGEILDSADVNEWRWIPTNENVADEATKCWKSINFDPSNRWFNGPEFLRRNESEWPKKRIVKPNVEEEMKAHCLHSSLVLPKLVDPKRFSKWNRMVRAVAYSIRFRKVFIDNKRRGKPLTQDEIMSAENHLFRQAQFEGFPSEMVILVRNESLPPNKKKFIGKPSPLYDGSPFLDGNQIMRMRQRTDGARDLSMDTKRPIILPKNSRITRLLVQHYHAKYYHQYHNTVINEIRQQFYIPCLRAVLKSVRYDCQMCKVRKATIMEPQMADLPPARMATFEKPFSYVGVDYFGPTKVKIGRRTEKRWGVLFTCLTIRAIHIDLVPSLDADSCIKVIRNFISDRGQVVEFHSDNGTHFTGANKELERELKKLDYERLETEFTSSYTKWVFNPPASPHMGGSWERLISSVKSGLYSVLPTRTPKEDTLRNMLKEIQNVVNSRPLTYIPLEVEEDEALTPNHFLYGSSNGMKPPCEIDINGEYLRKGWKEAQRLTQLFWKRFVREYLPTIARRTKWHKQVKQISPNDLVLVIDEKNPRNVYPRGRVLEAPVGSNGQVRRARIEMIAEARIDPNGKISKVRKTDMWRPAHKLAVLDVLSQTEGSFAQPILNRETGGRMLETNVNTGPRRSDRIAKRSGNTK